MDLTSSPIVENHGERMVCRVKFLIIQAQELRQNEFTKRGFLQSAACEQLKELI